MSFDELPPDSESPRDGAERTPQPDREASVQDAPPAGKTRRRRATTTGTDAASSAPTVESKPPRTRRASAKAKTTEPEAAPAESEPPTAPVKKRRGAKAATEETVDRPAQPAEKIEETAQETPAPPAARRSRRTKAAETAPVEEAAPVVETPPPAAAPRKRNPRTRTSVRSAVTDTAPDPQPSSELAPQATGETEIEASTTQEQTETAPAAKPKSRTRSRGKRVPAPAEDTDQTEAEANSATPAPASQEDTAPPASAEVPTSRSARSRRSRSRGKREGVKPEKAVADLAVEPEVIIPGPPPIVPRVIDRTVGSHLVMQGGVPRITIDNVARPPLLFFGNVQESGDKQRVLSEVRRAARAGVHLHSTLVELPCPLSEATHALDEIDRAMRAILDADPQGYVMPRIVFVPARGWKREYPTDIATYAEGPTGDPSLTSERFWREAEHSLTTLVEHLREYEWSGRIFGYHLERGEWFQPADQGYDRSMANREAFRDWLREKYKGSLVALRAAWYDGNVQFHTAEIPPVVAKPNPQRAFYETRRERSTIDFNAFTSDSTASRLAALAGAVKRAADDRALVSVCYGYTFEFGHCYSGHLSLGQLLECPDVDLICGPPSYKDRKPGGAASLPSPIDSVRLHGKLWLTEDDTKTFLAPVQQDPEDFNPRLGDRFQTDQSYARTMGRAYSTDTGIGFMDLWGEGWLDDDGLWDRIGTCAEHYSDARHSSNPRRQTDVVVLVDEKSLLHIQRGEAFFRKITAGMRELLQRSGVDYNVYLQSDLLNADFPTNAKLYLFANPYRLTADQRAAVAEKLQGGGRTLAWLYAPGSCEERPQIGGAMEESASGAIGLTLRQQEWNSEIGSRVVEQRHIITERLTPREIGVRERLNPSFYVEDPDATVLAEYQGSGLPSIAVKKCGNWQTVFVGEPALTWELFRGICKFAGVHLWTGGEDVAYIGNGWITVHASRDGHRAVRLPEASAVYDLTERRLVAEDLREHRFFLKAGATRTLCIGSVSRFRAMGLPNVNVPAPQARIMPERAPEPLPQFAPVPPAPEPTAALTADMETLQAVLSMDLSQIEGLPFDDLDDDDDIHIEPGDPAEAEARLAALLPDADILPAGRRRRRRGGRGRGRRRPDGTEAADAEAGAISASADGAPIGNGSGEAAEQSPVEVRPIGPPEPASQSIGDINPDRFEPDESPMEDPI